MQCCLSVVEMSLSVKSGKRERTFTSFREVSDTRMLHLSFTCLDFYLNFLFKEKNSISETKSFTVLR
jgi:hypothetical protein